MSYNNAIWCTGNVGRLDLSKAIFNELLDNPRLKPNVYTYGSLLHACAKGKNHQLALKYLDQMETFGIRPNQVGILRTRAFVPRLFPFVGMRTWNYFLTIIPMIISTRFTQWFYMNKKCPYEEFS